MRFNICKQSKYSGSSFLVEIGGKNLNDDLIVVEKANGFYSYNIYNSSSIKEFFIRKFGFNFEDFDEVKRSVYIRNLLRKRGILLSSIKKFGTNKIATLKAKYFGKKFLLIDRGMRRIYGFDSFDELVNILINEYKFEIDKDKFLEIMNKVVNFDNRNLRQYLYYALYKSAKYNSQEEFCEKFGITRPAIIEIIRKIEKGFEIPKIDKERLLERLKKLQEKLEEIRKRLEK